MVTTIDDPRSRSKRDGSAMSLDRYNIAERSLLAQPRNFNPDDDDDPRATTTN
jgi:hypothetical protein